MLFRSEAASEKIQRDVEHVLPELRRIADGRERMVIRDEVERRAPLRQFERGAHHPEVIADMQFPARLDSRQNAHGGAGYGAPRRHARKKLLLELVNERADDRDVVALAVVGRLVVVLVFDHDADAEIGRAHV